MKTIILRTDDIHRGNLILVNQEHSYQEQHAVLCSVGTWEGADILYERTAAAALNKLIQEIGGAGQIVPVSAWRSLAEQQKIWDDSLAEHGLEFTQSYVAVPGHSEHQTGLAIDLALNQPQIDFICPCFPYEGICQRFRQKAAEYGFIERYQEDKQAVTGIGHEPWHFRYVLQELLSGGYDGFLSVEPHLGTFAGLAGLELDDKMAGLPQGGEGTFTLAYRALEEILDRISVNGMKIF